MIVNQGSLSFFGNQLFFNRSDTVAAVVPDAFGFEFQMADGRLHFTTQNHKLYFEMADGRLHFDLGKED